jgi:hypothetical protein
MGFVAAAATAAEMAQSLDLPQPPAAAAPPGRAIGDAGEELRQHPLFKAR